MPTDQDREFELVLGNKQLFSLLFLVFVLLGVFFAMGYAMGRSSTPLEVAKQTPTVSPDTEAPITARPATTEGSAMPPTIPAAETARPAEPVATVQTPPAKTTAPPAEELPASRFINPKPGQVFLQVSAVARPEAELLLDVLSRKGFRAAMAPGPSEKFIRVLVGPTTSDAELTKLRSGLEALGLKPIVRRY